MLYLKNSGQTFRHLLSAFFIYPLILPIFLLDFALEIYHRIGFRLYRIPRIKRGQYIQIDRHKLEYLTFFQKINCFYCGYTNGVIHYWSKIAAESERYWCGIQHQKNPNFIPPEHHRDFIEYNNKKDYRDKYQEK
jgi:hypothetical protein